MITMRPIMFILAVFLSILTSCQDPPDKEEAARPVKAMQIEDPKLIHSRPFPGVARAENRVNLSFRVNGPLIEFPVDVGDEVKKKDVIAKIDPKDFEIDLRNAQATLEKSKAELNFAQSDFARAERIQKQDPGAISESKVDEKREERNRLRAVVEGNEAAVEGAKNQLSYTQLVAPFDGIIVTKYFDNYEYVQARQAVVRMLDTSRVEMVVDIPQGLIPYIHLVKKIVVAIGSFPDREFHAAIKEIGTEASTTTRTYPVTLVMEQPKDIRILAGMSGEATLIGSIEPDSPYVSIIIPASAVFSEEDQTTYVWVIDRENNIVNKREVKVGEMTSDGVRILGGLNPGEWIAIAGVHFLQEGQEVEIMKPE